VIVARVAVALVAVAPLAFAQSRVAEGRVTRAIEGSPPQPVVRQWVVLHRVGNDRSAPLDSMRTDRAGRYRIRYVPSGDPDALYFVSVRHAGIAYFSPPLRASTVRGGDADVLVYDTTTDTTTLRVQGRHLVVSAPRGSRREIAEIFEIENASGRTVVARDSMSPLWSIMLPAQAESAAVGPGDLSLSAVVFRNKRAEVYAPISPGVRQLVLTYLLPPSAFPLSSPLSRQTSVLEVLLEEPRAIVEGARLGEVSPASIDGRMFRRFLAQEVPASAVMRVTAPPPIEQNQSMVRLLVAGTAIALILGFGIWFIARRPRLKPTASHLQPPASSLQSNLLIAELATLDAKFEAAQPSAEQRTAHEQQRAHLKERIARALADEQAPV
jgi:hypothetical protein